MSRQFVRQVTAPFRRLQWKLTLSYTLVTVGSLLVVVLIAGYLLFSRVLAPQELLDSALSPAAWIQAASLNASPRFRYLLSQNPIDTHLVSLLLQEGDLQVTYLDLFRLGDLQVRARTTGRGSVLLVDPHGVLVGTSNPAFVPETALGQPLDPGLLPGLEGPLQTALRGQVDPQRLFVTLEPDERFYFAVPYLDEDSGELLGVGIIYFERLPTSRDLPAHLRLLLGRSLLVLLLAAGLIGTLFGVLTSGGMVRRLQRVSQAAAAWSRGDFSEFIDDPGGDEISRLSARLNRMAEQLQGFIRRSRETAASEERSRLARDLHDSAKQQALAASLHLGAAQTLFERDPQAAKGHLREAEDLVDSVRAELTDLIDELHPTTLRGERFDEILNDYLIDWAQQTGITAAFCTRGSGDLPMETRLAVYRILQEALANTARHSAAGFVEVELDLRGERIEFSVRDDGAGFDTGLQYAGMGLHSMRERAESLEGEFHIESRAGAGTVIRVSFPREG